MLLGWMGLSTHQLLLHSAFLHFNYWSIFHFGQLQDLNLDRTKLITLLHFWQQTPLQLDEFGPNYFTSQNALLPKLKYHGYTSSKSDLYTASIIGLW